MFAFKKLKTLETSKVDFSESANNLPRVYLHLNFEFTTQFSPNESTLVDLAVDQETTNDQLWTRIDENQFNYSKNEFKSIK